MSVTRSPLTSETALVGMYRSLPSPRNPVSTLRYWSVPLGGAAKLPGAAVLEAWVAAGR